MRVANSALYARRTPVVTLPQAIAWLGIREIRNIAFAVAVQGQVFSSTYFRKEMNDLWRESVITALFAQEIARLKRRNVESAYLCGLLHRAGMAVILSRVGSAVLKHRLTPDAERRGPDRDAPRGARRHASRHRLESAARGLCRHLALARSAAGGARAHRSDGSRARAPDLRRDAHAGRRRRAARLACSGRSRKWMDELSIYPDELFTIMAQRAAIYATAESFT